MTPTAARVVCIGLMSLLCCSVNGEHLCLLYLVLHSRGVCSCHPDNPASLASRRNADLGHNANTCLLAFASAAAQQQLGRRGLLQAGPARAMNAPILAEEAVVLEAGPTAKRSTATRAAVQQQPRMQQPIKPQPGQQQARSLLATTSATHYHDHRRYRGLRPQQWQRYGRYDRAALSPWLAGANRYSGVSRQPLPLLGALLGGTLSSLLSANNPSLAANSLAQAYGGGRSDEAAQAVASGLAGDGASSSQASAMARAVAQTAVSHPNVAPGLLAKSADLAVSRGRADAYASNLANAFGYAKQSSQVPQLTSALCGAINQGGDAARVATGQAIAKAIAGGGDSRQAVAEATANALCSGDASQAQAWSSAFAVALSTNQQGCLVLNEAKAMAQARCGADGTAEAVSNAEASSSVLGFCGLMLDGVFGDGADMSFSGGSSSAGSGGSGGFGQQPQYARGYNSGGGGRQDGFYDGGWGK